MSMRWPRFWNSIVYTKYLVLHRVSVSTISAIKDSSFILNTRATRSGRSDTVWPINRLSQISGHWGLHVNVVNKWGFPNFVTKVIASRYCCLILRGERGGMLMVESQMFLRCCRSRALVYDAPNLYTFTHANYAVEIAYSANYLAGSGQEMLWHESNKRRSKKIMRLLLAEPCFVTLKTTL